MESLLLDQLFALSHPQRLAVFRLLVRRCPDALPAGEIGRVLDLKPSTASVYLAVLTRAGLITQTREGTQLRYAVNAGSVQDLVAGLLLDCCKGRPDLCPPGLRSPLERTSYVPARKFNVLFICTGNSARSILAEAILTQLAGDRFNAFSAGTKPSAEPNPRVLNLLRSRQVDVSALKAKNMSVFLGKDAPAFDFVFTVCDRAANEQCPTWEAQPINAHWGIPDPARIVGSDSEENFAFQEAYVMIHQRISAFVALPVADLDRVSLQQKIDDIGREKEATT